MEADSTIQAVEVEVVLIEAEAAAEVVVMPARVAIADLEHGFRPKCFVLCPPKINKRELNSGLSKGGVQVKMSQVEGRTRLVVVMPMVAADERSQG